MSLYSSNHATHMSVVRTVLNVSSSLLHVYPCIHINLCVLSQMVDTHSYSLLSTTHTESVCFFFFHTNTQLNALCVPQCFIIFMSSACVWVFFYSLTNLHIQSVYSRRSLSNRKHKNTHRDTQTCPASLLLSPCQWFGVFPCAFTASQCPCISSSGLKPGPWTIRGPASSGSAPGAWNPANDWRRSCRSVAGRSGLGRPTETPWSPWIRETAR